MKNYEARMSVNGAQSREVSAKIYPSLYLSLMFVGYTAVDMSFGFHSTLYFRLHFTRKIFTFFRNDL